MTSGNFSICGLTLQPGNLGNTQTGATVSHMQYYTAAIPAAPQQIILLLDFE